MTLDVIIATLGPDGIARVASMQLPELQNVNYIVSWQEPGDTPIPSSLLRPDIHIHTLTGRGLSRNRNNALEHSGADIRLIADDDLSYTPGALRAVIEAFESRPDMDMACFMYDGPDNKTYPAAECDLRHIPKNYYVTSFEMAMRNRGSASALRYDERFGLGSRRFTLGEENELLHRVRLMGLTVRFIPIVITRHSTLTSGNRNIHDHRAHAAQGALIAIEYPCTWPLRVPLKAWRLWRAGQSPFFPTLIHGLRGSLWSIFYYRPIVKKY